MAQSSSDIEVQLEYLDTAEAFRGKRALFQARWKSIKRGNSEGKEIFQDFDINGKIIGLNLIYTDKVGRKCPEKR